MLSITRICHERFWSYVPTPADAHAYSRAAVVVSAGSHLNVRDDDLGLGHVAGALVALIAWQGPLAGEQRGEDQNEQDHEDGQQEVGSLAGLAFPARTRPYECVATGTMRRGVGVVSTRGWNMSQVRRAALYRFCRRI